MKIGNLKIGVRLTIGFWIMIILMAVVGVVSQIATQRLTDFTDKMYLHPLAVSNAVRDIKTHTVSIQLSMKDVILAENDADIEEAVAMIDTHEKHALTAFELVKERFLGDQQDVRKAEQTFIDWKPIRQEVIQLIRESEKRKAAIITKGKDAEHLDQLNNEIQVMIDFANSKADNFRQNATDTKTQTTYWTIALSIGVFIMSVVIASIITNSITTPLNKIVRGMKSIAKGDLSYEVYIDQKDQIGKLADSFRDMQNYSRHKADIAERIATGDFSKKVDSKSENDLVALSINQIVDSFSEVVQQARRVAAGDYTSEIYLKSDNDQLGIAINEMVRSLRQVVMQTNIIAGGDYSADIAPASEKDELGIALQNMTGKLRDTSLENQRQNWLKTGQNELNEKMSGDFDVPSLARNIITYLAKYLNAQVGAFYIANEQETELTLTGSYAFTQRKSISGKIKFGEGLAGQAAFEREIISLTNIPDDYIRINSALGDTKPRNIILLPFVYEGKVMGVIELGAFEQFSDDAIELLKNSMESIAIIINSTQSHDKMNVLLKETQELASELQAQQEELRVSNEELAEQTQRLQASEEELRVQQEELQMTNVELEEKTDSLAKQKEEISKKNQALEITRIELERKAEELETSSRYKSEFLANMSHELRTPLNSLLILSRDLAMNKKGKLDEDQVESAEIIHKSGNDLLTLINDILDLSKIEAGKMSIIIDEITLEELASGIKLNFQHMTNEKGLELIINISPNLPNLIMTDQQRLRQILRNMMSNAIKFTHHGSVTLEFHRPDPAVNLSRSRLIHQNAIAISVIDTGIGIPKHKQLDIFESFQQADGSTSRNYGGTGLGLSISRELSKLLGGELQLVSAEGQGSTFTIYIPEQLEESEMAEKAQPAKTYSPPSRPTAPIASVASITPPVKKQKLAAPELTTAENYVPSPTVNDDKDNINDDDRVILAIEDDLNFAKTLYKFCRDRGFKYIHAGDGRAGIEFANKFQPDAIVLDIMLPGIEGWGVLDALKNNSKTRHIPVHMMSVEDETIDAFKKGAIGYLTKPITNDLLDGVFTKIEDLIARNIKDLLIVEDDENLRKSIIKLIGNGDVKVTPVSSGEAALRELKNKVYDCMILDLSLPDISGFELLQNLDEAHDIPIPPVIIYTGKDITREEEYKLKQYADTIIVKGVGSAERLLDETAMFLHRVVDNLPTKKRNMISRLRDKNSMLEGKKILLVDDDMRNVFALSKVMSDKGLEIYKAANGQKALDILADENNHIDLVLMDIMMPVMDGYEAMKLIRAQDRFWNLPILALTAKAMRDDRDKCIAAGANDYLPKPVDVDRLLSLMRVWLYK